MLRSVNQKVFCFFLNFLSLKKKDLKKKWFSKKSKK